MHHLYWLRCQACPRDCNCQLLRKSALGANRQLLQHAYKIELKVVQDDTPTLQGGP